MQVSQQIWLERDESTSGLVREFSQLAMIGEKKLDIFKQVQNLTLCLFVLIKTNFQIMRKWFKFTEIWKETEPFNLH